MKVRNLSVTMKGIGDHFFALLENPLFYKKKSSNCAMADLEKEEEAASLRPPAGKEKVGGRKKVDGRGGGDGDVIILFRNKMAIAERIEEEGENAKINEARPTVQLC